MQITRSRTLPHSVPPASELLEELINNTGVGERSVRLLGVSLSSLQGELSEQRFQQGDLFRDI